MSKTQGKRKHREECKVSNGSNEKICRICGDKALYFNFSAISCESCKAFFRRNSKYELSNFMFVFFIMKDFFFSIFFYFSSCPFENRCKVTLQNRKACKKCRLKKCYEVKTIFIVFRYVKEFFFVFF